MARHPTMTRYYAIHTTKLTGLEFITLEYEDDDPTRLYIKVRNFGSSSGCISDSIIQSLEIVELQ